MNTQKILCASHDTLGSRAAEAEALKLCGAGGSLHHLVVVPDFWKGMMGDDWLNNAATQIRFSNYVETQLEEEIKEHITRLAEEAKNQNVRYSYGVMQGKPSECLVEASCQEDYDLVIIGSPRPKEILGYRSRMALEKLVSGITIPLLIVPFPTL